jgi:ubiquinone/menaquinone biosynthesis C-methylase UbiE
MPAPTLRDKLFSYYYFSRPQFVNGTAHFFSLMSLRIRIDSRILEIGAGPSNPTSEYLSGIGRVIGLDISEAVTRNRFVAEAHTYDGRQFPFSDASVDACVSDYVLEHVADPLTHFKEVARVLRPGGVFCFRTVNLWHYIFMVSRLTPLWVHKMVALSSASGRTEAYPTHYKANSLARLRWLQRIAGLDAVELNSVEAEPSYASAVTFFPMMAYERLVNSTSRLARFRAGITGCFARPANIQRAASSAPTLALN